MGVFSYSVDSEGVGRLIIDSDDPKINKLTTPVMSELRAIIEELRQDSSISVLLIESVKPGIFIAGADIAEIRDISNSVDGKEKAQAGQAVLDALESLPFPTVCVIDGACLGGGYEFALACTYRIASDSPKVLIGLPEVSLGIMPGFGGTQRFPRMVGLQRSLPIILAGKSVPAQKALRSGMIDAVVPQGFLASRAREFALSVLDASTAQSVVAKRRPRGAVARFLEDTAVGRSIVYRQSKQSVLKTTKGHYPAPLAALDTIKRSLNLPLAEGLLLEAQAFSELVPTPTCKNLIQLFYNNEALKKDPGAKADARSFARAGVLGAGLMGGGISWLFSYRNIPVRMKDMNWDALALGLNQAKKVYEQLRKIRKLDRREVGLGMDRISPTLSYDGFSKLDVVVEAIVEDMDIKKTVLAELETHTKSDAIIVSNTSSLSITEMASALSRPSQFAGFHFFSPVNRMPLVEVIPGADTSPETIASLVALAKTLKKTPIVVKDVPGFLVNRILIPYVNEAARLVEEGISIQRIDRLMERFGMPIGPLALADEVGLDVGYKVAKVLADGYGDRMAVSPSFSILYDDLKLLGKKSGRGFYVHSGKEKTPNPDVVAIQKEGNRVSDAEIIDRLVLIMVNEAARCLDEAVVASPEYLDMAMILGTGFPPFRGGLCRYADSEGISSVVQRLESLSVLGTRFLPADGLTQRAGANQRFYS